jgi:hypothetical protein
MKVRAADARASGRQDMQTTMTFQSLRRFATQVLVVTAAFAAMMTSGAPAQSLGDVARQEEARRKGAGAGKTYTNDTLKSAPAPAATLAPTPSAPGSLPAAPADAAKPAAGDKPSDRAAKPGDAQADAKPAAAPQADAAAWKKRKQDLETAIERSKAFADALQSQINGLTTDFAARDDPAQRNAVAANRQKALTELDRVKKEITANTKALADLSEEARRAGVPPGWLR